MEKFWVSFLGCKCSKSILIECGYESEASLKCLNEILLNEVEEYVNSNKDELLKKIDCEHKKTYTNQKQFKFLLGQRAIILDWCQNHLKNNTTPKFDMKHESFPPLLQDIIDTSLSNYNTPDNRHRYTNLINDFSIYLYIMAGKACYEVLSANLNLPKASTIRKYKFKIIFPIRF